MKARAELNNALDLVCKLIMNNLYGKFGQRQEVEQIQFLTIEQVNQLLSDIETGKEKKIYQINQMCSDDWDYELMPYACKSKIIVHHRHVLIAALITAQCRINITALAERYHKTAIYCDTDSFITQSKVDKRLVNPDKLGALKLEHENVDIQFFGRKQYHIIGTNEIKQKGVKIKDIPKFLSNIETKGKFTAPYQAPTSIKGSLKNGIENASKFNDYTRAIKPDLSSREKGLLKIDN
jgi:hypothetical protein